MTIDLGYGHKITGTADTLNHISVVLMEAVESYRKKGLDGLARSCERESDIIYRVLKEKGFYDTK